MIVEPESKCLYRGYLLVERTDGMYASRADNPNFAIRLSKRTSIDRAEGVRLMRRAVDELLGDTTC